MVACLWCTVKHYLPSLAIVATAATSFSLIGTTVLADGDVSEFGALAFAPSLEQCRSALAQGNILKVEGNTYYVYFDVALFTIEVDENGMRCRAVRHINK